MFIRIFRKDQNGRIAKELLLNTDHISKIEVEYGVPSAMPEKSRYQGVSVAAGVEDPEAVRMYRVHVAGEVLFLESNPNDPVLKVVDDIYKAAVKG